MTDAVQQAEAALTEARKALRETGAARDTAVNAVRDEWRLTVAAAERVEREAAAALAAAKSAAAPDHEWTGKKVFRIEEEFARFSNPRRKIGETRFDGIVETYRPGTSLGRGHHVYTIGTPIVRLLKKDGTPGAKTENLARTYGGEWKLAEEAQALQTGDRSR